MQHRLSLIQNFMIFGLIALVIATLLTQHSFQS